MICRSGWDSLGSRHESPLLFPNQLFTQKFLYMLHQFWYQSLKESNFSFPSLNANRKIHHVLPSFFPLMIFRNFLISSFIIFFQLFHFCFSFRKRRNKILEKNKGEKNEKNWALVAAAAIAFSIIAWRLLMITGALQAWLMLARAPCCLREPHRSFKIELGKK